MMSMFSSVSLRDFYVIAMILNCANNTKKKLIEKIMCKDIYLIEGKKKVVFSVIFSHSLMICSSKLINTNHPSSKSIITPKSLPDL